MTAPGQRSDGTVPEHVDVLVVGAGLSGIGAAAQLRQHHPGRSVAVLEARERSGGTWDLFRYPGVRSDSDMFTFGFRWRPWDSDVALADGALILRYLRTVAAEHGVDRLVRHRHRVVEADWDPDAARWRVLVERPGADGEPERVTLTTDLLWACSGYYAYDHGYTPDLPGLDSFAGTLVHPQHWPADLDHTGRRVVVIGSGATAVTLVPALAADAAHVTMLQRSPGYVMSLPGRDPLARRLRRLPRRITFPLLRWKNILAAVGSYELSRWRPSLVRRMLRERTARQLPPGVDVDVDFKPGYDPWDQRLCFVPDGDLFRALRDGSASVVTGGVAEVTPTGVRLASGDHLDADVLVTATGLRLQAFGAMTLRVAGEVVDLPSTMAYKGMMLSGVPNFVFTVGYTNNSWTLKADLVSGWVVRLLEHLDRTGARTVVAPRDPSVGERPFLDLESGYVLRGIDAMPRQGDRPPWGLRQNYLSDLRRVARAPVDDDVLVFGS